jgi:uncharacterized protein involved in type VI secretion and phage assembly
MADEGVRDYVKRMMENEKFYHHQNFAAVEAVPRKMILANDKMKGTYKHTYYFSVATSIYPEKHIHQDILNETSDIGTGFKIEYKE